MSSLPGFFQNVFDIVGPWVTKMFNLSLSSGVFPSSFKHATVEPKLKKPSLHPSDLQTFRPRAKLPFLAKISEKVVSKQLTSFLEAHNGAAVAQEEESPVNRKVGGSTPASPGYMSKCPWARH